MASSEPPAGSRVDVSGRPGESAADATARAVDEAILRERTRIARELHDGLAADLASAVAMFKLYLETPSEAPGREETLRRVFETVETTLASAREILQALRPKRLGERGLIAGLRAMAEEYERLHRIRIELWTSGDEADLTRSQREVVFHVVREALTNVRRHSGAAVCRVRLAFAAKPFLVEVTDEGRGFDAAAAGGYGLIGMRERAAGIGGRLEVVSTPDRGTTVFLFGPEAPGAF
ncbi:MAG: sensor histidine kinase [Candidatus Dormibacterales bacterium]